MPRPKAFERERRAIGAEAEIGGVAEGDEPAAADQEMQARRIEHEDEHFRRDGEEVMAGDERQQRRDRQGENGDAAGLAA